MQGGGLIGRKLEAENKDTEEARGRPDSGRLAPEDWDTGLPRREHTPLSAWSLPETGVHL